jgi:hypothetical protein
MPSKKYIKKRLIQVRRYKNHTTITISYRHPDFRHIRSALKWASLIFNKNIKIFNAVSALVCIMVGVYGLSYISRPYIINYAESQIEFDVVRPSVATINHLPRSIPLQLEIKSINLLSNIIKTDINPDNTLAVPEDYGIAAWYAPSPTPGEIGPAVLVGHATSPWGDGVFANLSKVQAGDSVKISREDNSTAIFTVDDIVEFPQESFPSDKVYGNINYSGLRIITCGGVYNYLSGRYSNNVVVFASLK